MNPDSQERAERPASGGDVPSGFGEAATTFRLPYFGRLWASNLIHAGGARKDLYRTRHSQVTHVFFEDCKYWTPMKSGGLEVCWRDPQFIPPVKPAKKGLFRR